MTRRLLAGVTALALFAGSQALAQTVSIEISPEQRTKIKQYVVQEKVKPVRVEERLAVGATIPAEVALSPVPPAWGAPFVKYRYVYTDDHVVLVDPSSRRVVEIID
jgi:hypothetical protein